MVQKLLREADLSEDISEHVEEMARPLPLSADDDDPDDWFVVIRADAPPANA